MKTIADILRIAALTLLLGAHPAFAHAIIVSSEPKPQQTVKGPDLEIVIRFNSRIDAGRSRLTLKSSGGSVILPLEAADEGNTLRGSASNLGDGSYELLWQTLSVDGHITHGAIPFRVSR